MKHCCNLQLCVIISLDIIIYSNRDYVIRLAILFRSILFLINTYGYLFFYISCIDNISSYRAVETRTRYTAQNVIIIINNTVKYMQIFTAFKTLQQFFWYIVVASTTRIVTGFYTYNKIGYRSIKYKSIFKETLWVSVFGLQK